MTARVELALYLSLILLVAAVIVYRTPWPLLAVAAVWLGGRR